MASSLRTIYNFRGTGGKRAELAKSRGELSACTSRPGWTALGVKQSVTLYKEKARINGFSPQTALAMAFYKPCALPGRLRACPLLLLLPGERWWAGLEAGPAARSSPSSPHPQTFLRPQQLPQPDWELEGWDAPRCQVPCWAPNKGGAGTPDSHGEANAAVCKPCHLEPRPPSIKGRFLKPDLVGCWEATVLSYYKGTEHSVGLQ